MRHAPPGRASFCLTLSWTRSVSGGSAPIPVPPMPVPAAVPPLAPKPKLRVLLCAPRSFCAGVVRAIETVERALDLYGPPVYVRPEIVHNRYVVDTLRAKGAI